MAYTIKGLAKANECEELSERGLAEVWLYWLTCNVNDRQCVDDFKRLRKTERKRMLDYMNMWEAYRGLASHIIRHMYE